MISLWRAVIGPSLYRIRGTEGPGIDYSPNKVERYSDYALLASKCIWFLVKVTSPVWLVIIWRRGGFEMTEKGTAQLMGLFRLAFFVASFTGAALVVRGIGRLYNAQYMHFIRNLDTYRRQRTPEVCDRLMREYDCDFAALPVDFTVTAPLKGKLAAPSLSICWRIFALAILKTIGRRLMYPGSLQLFNAALHSTLTQGRAKIIEEKGAKRGKIKTADGNFIDTLFVDNRRSENPLGRTLVICCEGNAGFYEIGIMNTPMQLGYSVLGWNHPGFGSSTGEPLPSQELHAAEAVMHYAQDHLGFSESNISVFAWSIGGFPASWLAAHYPKINGVLLDASFDDILPLALARMPTLLATPVTHVVRHYLNLNVADQLCRYDGPVLLIRRTLDEIISINHEDESKAGNRGDYLLKRILSHRYPQLVNESTMPLLNDWLRASKKQKEFLYATFSGPAEMDGAKRFEHALVELSISDPRDIRFPLNIGQGLALPARQHLALYVAKLHMFVPEFYQTVQFCLEDVYSQQG